MSLSSQVWEEYIVNSDCDWNVWGSFLKLADMMKKL